MMPQPRRHFPLREVALKVSNTASFQAIICGFDVWLSLDQYYMSAVYRWISHAHIRSRDSRAVAARIFELAKRDLGCILPDLPNPEDVPNDTDSEAE